MKINLMLDIQNALRNKEEIYIFCAGTLGQELHTILMEAGILVTGFIDNASAKQGTKIHNLMVYHADQVCKAAVVEHKKLYIIVASYLQTIQIEVLKQLKRDWIGVAYRVNVPYGSHDFIQDIDLEQEKKDQYCVEQGMYLRYNGDIFPCCRSCWNSDLKIGNILEADISDKIKKFDKPCQCTKYRLKSTKEKIELVIQRLHIEFSLSCQGNCLPCCVLAPWTRESKQYCYFQAVENFIKDFSVKKLLVQGGEIFVQKDTVMFLEGLKSRIEGLSIAIITNGNFDLSRSKSFQMLFDEAHFSFMGFQPDTYQLIMGLQRQKTMDFIDSVRKSFHGRMKIKFITLPSNIHEICSFVQYGLDIEADLCISSGNIFQYINQENTWDSYWFKLIERSKSQFRDLLIEKKDEIKEKNIHIEILAELKIVYGIDHSFLVDNELLNDISFI